MRFKFLIPFIDHRLILRFLITLQLLYNVEAGGLLPLQFFGFSSIARFLGVFIPALGIFHPISCRTLDRRNLHISEVKLLLNLVNQEDKLAVRTMSAFMKFTGDNFSSFIASSATQKADERKAWLRLNFFGRPESEAETMMLKWANKKDRNEWREGGFDPKDVLVFSRVLGMDGHFLDSVDSMNLLEYVVRWLLLPSSESSKIYEIILWFKQRLGEEKYLRRLTVFETLIDPDRPGKPWWTPSEMEKWIQHTDWDPSKIIKVGYALRLDDKTHIMKRPERDAAFLMLYQFLDPVEWVRYRRTQARKSKMTTHPDSVMTTLPDSVMTTLPDSEKKVVTYIPEALAVNGKPYRNGPLYRQRLDILAGGELHPEGYWGPPEPGSFTYRVYWIARGLDPDGAFGLDEEQFKTAEPIVSFESFAAQSWWDLWTASLANFVLQLPLGSIRHIWKNLAKVRPA
ncbi:hypothetical protein CROQUDRAFT_105027 [Cronartium quercuum f. sp. fusiforme G11]|uniref:Uncharacterized protein n=1 Tax=Cronartium quercuum f. sp. fusiforme G11 TaxID=708437 RepID=A0A9P6NSK3_9BASI|nr:hypothetical protein CROQUDRAFT_105027 [Cronartium quercuum f. sp. fusiforme G11]